MQCSDKNEASRTQDTAVVDYADLKGPTLLKRTLGLQRRHHGLYLGSGGRYERQLVPESCGETNVKLLRDISFRHVSNHDAFVVHPDAGTQMYEDELADLDVIENTVSPHGRALIDLYFRIIHPSFPILHKRVYLEKYERSHREFSPALLAAVYILAMTYWTYSPELSGFSIPDVVKLERLATKALNYAVHRPKLSTVEAGLLLLQRSTKASWSLTAQMVAVSQDLGLHRDCSSWDIPEWEKGLRKRLGWAVFMQDKWASLVHGRPSHIFATDWAVIGLNDQDFPESFADEDDNDGSTEVVNGRNLFTYMTSLTIILSEILTTFYSGNVAEEIVRQGPDATNYVLVKAKPLQIRLRGWYTAVPGYLNTEQIKIRKLSSSGYLHLAYWATEITLHRCIVRTLSSCSNAHLVSICYSAASARSKSAIEFVESLKPEHWQSFWYFASEFNFGLIGLFEALVSHSTDIRPDSKDGISMMDRYRWSLIMASRNAGFLKGSLEMLDTVAADNPVKEGGLGSNASCFGAQETRVGRLDHQVPTPRCHYSPLDDQLQDDQWPLIQSQVLGEFPMDHDQLSWSQDGLFETDLRSDE